MAYDFSNLTVADVVREKLSWARLSDQLKIDYCCHGDQPLNEPCREAGVNPQQVCAELIAHDAAVDNKNEADWETASVHALVYLNALVQTDV